MKASRLILPMILLSLFACSTGTPIVWIEREVSLSGWRTVEVARIVDETGKQHEFDVSGILAQEVSDKLKSRGFVIWDDKTVDQNVIILSCRLTAYAAGSAFARWVAPGAGKTECVLKCKLAEKASGKPLGEIMAERRVSAGGLYTIGYEKRILAEVGEDIASELAKATGSTATGTAR